MTPEEEKILQQKEIAKMFAHLPDEEKKLVETHIKSKQRGLHAIAMYIMSKYHIITIGEHEREMYVYMDGYYRPAENLVVYPEIQRILQFYATNASKREIFGKIADMTQHERDVFESVDPRYINLKNGVYDRVEKKLLGHSPKYKFRYMFPITYKHEAECPLTRAFLDQVLTEEQRKTIEEWIGYMFMRNYMYKKAVIIVGEGDTGKTTLLEVVTNLIGRENISSVSLHKLAIDKFAAAHMYEKHANIWDELSAKDIGDTGAFKMATGGGTITGEYKFGNQFSFNNYSKLTFACNRIPDVNDFSDEAYFNRWMVIRFEKIIEKRIPNFVQSLTTDEERSGLFLLAMEGLDRLLENNGFTYGNTAIDTKMEMMRNGSSIARFVKDGIYRDNGNTVTNEEVYKAYETFCENNGLELETKTMLSNKLPFYATYVVKAQVYDNSYPPQQVRGWRNVNITLSEEEQEERSKMDNWMDETADAISSHAASVIIKPS